MPPSASTARRLVLITGSTRSGTSLAAGTLHHLGLHVPQPVLKANDSNPAGFFESTWPVAFHRRLMDRSLVGVVDARPEAFDLVANAVRAEERAELRAWLDRELAVSDRIVVKDPRAAWVTPAWQDAVEVLGGRAGILLMVRHPAEVVASRSTYYASDLEGDRAWRYRVRNLCGWLNLNTGVEQATRGRPRAVVRYEDLLDDWRRVIRELADAFGLELELDPDEAGARAVDRFIDPGLRRHVATWTGSDLPDELVELAEDVWSALGELATGRSRPGATDRLDALRAAFVRRMRVAAAMTPDVSTAAVRADRRAREEPGAEGSTPKPAGRAAPAGRARRLVRRWVPAGLRRRAVRTQG